MMGNSFGLGSLIKHPGNNYGDKFVFTVNTALTATNSTGDTEYSIPIFSVQGPSDTGDRVFDITVDWGNGDAPERFVNTHGFPNYSYIRIQDSNQPTKDYGTPGIYQISITGDFSECAGTASYSHTNGKDKLKLLEIKNWGQLKLNYRSFYNCVNMTCTATDTPGIAADSWGNKRPRYAFNGASLFNTDSLNNLDMSGVTNIVGMFQSAPKFNGDIGGWDTSDIQDFARLFFDYSTSSDFDQDISGWDITAINNSTWSLREMFVPGKGGLSTENYDKVLISWAAQDIGPTSMTMGMGDSTYTAGGAAEAARTSLINNQGFTITDGGAG